MVTNTQSGLGVVLNPNYYHSYSEMFYIGSRFDVTRVKRLIIEALEISINLCNHSLDRYGLSKLYDVMHQILPTAYVLNTSYWVFYSTEKGNCLCVCSRFGLHCPHYRNENHWINMQPIPEPHECFFFSSLPVTLSCFEPDVTVESVFENNYVFYDVIMKLKFHLNFLRNIPIVTTFIEGPELTTTLRYHFTKEYYPLENVMVQFKPLPTFHPSYGRHCVILLHDQLRANVNDLTATCARRHTVVVKEMPKFKIAGNPVLFTIFKRPLYNPFINNLSLNPVKMISPHLLAGNAVQGIGSGTEYQNCQAMFNNINMNQLNVNVVNTSSSLPFFQGRIAIPLIKVELPSQMFGNNAHLSDDRFQAPTPSFESEPSTRTSRPKRACKTNEEYRKRKRVQSQLQPQTKPQPQTQPEHQTQPQPPTQLQRQSQPQRQNHLQPQLQSVITSASQSEPSTSTGASSIIQTTSQEASTADSTTDELAKNNGNKAQKNRDISVTELLESTFPHPLVYDDMTTDEYLDLVCEVINEDLEKTAKMTAVIQMTKPDEETRSITLTASDTGHNECYEK